VFQCAKAVNIPIIGCGGISTAEDAIEYMLAGASAVQIGTATFLQPAAMIDVIDGIEKFCLQRAISRVADLVRGVVIEEADDQDLAWLSPTT
jgi:dihydroorotate dehydrogenase (NAD+) catalytic subunit